MTPEQQVRAAIIVDSLFGPAILYETTGHALVFNHHGHLCWQPDAGIVLLHELGVIDSEVLENAYAAQDGSLSPENEVLLARMFGMPIKDYCRLLLIKARIAVFMVEDDDDEEEENEEDEKDGKQDEKDEKK